LGLSAHRHARRCAARASTGADRFVGILHPVGFRHSSCMLATLATLWPSERSACRRTSDSLDAVQRAPLTRRYPSLDSDSLQWKAQSSVQIVQRRTRAQTHTRARTLHVA
jgi:hypothetical protein